MTIFIISYFAAILIGALIKKGEKLTPMKMIRKHEFSFKERKKENNKKKGDLSLLIYAIYCNEI